MQQLTRIFSYFNPIFLYYTGIYGLSKIIEFSLGTGSIWQLTWDKMRDIFGSDETVYSTWILNIYTTILYWAVGFALIAIEKYKGSKVLENYKIQTNKSEINQKDKLSEVSKIKLIFRFII